MFSYELLPRSAIGDALFRRKYDERGLIALGADPDCLDGLIMIGRKFPSQALKLNTEVGQRARTLRIGHDLLYRAAE